MVIRDLMALYVHPELEPLSGGPEQMVNTVQNEGEPSTPQMVWNPDSRPEGTTAIWEAPISDSPSFFALCLSFPVKRGGWKG
jgi:hypothetical protein